MAKQIEESSKQTTPAESSHLRTYLDYYKELEKPGYAVLITGAWGSGKTHQVRNILSESEIYYISLFGTQTTEEVYSAVYARMFPIKAFARGAAEKTDGAELEISFAKINLGGVVSGIANALLRDQVNTDRIIVFDDLERSSILTKDLLGVFNRYVEHHGCRVVVIAHDEKISADLQDTKEKVFGQTIEVTPQISDAFDSFTEGLKDQEARNTINLSKSDILNIFQQSETYSLRILKHTIEDLGRLLKTLSAPHKSNSAAMRELSFLFLATSLEVRSGRLKESDLIERSQSIMRYQLKRARVKENLDIPPIFSANVRYDSIDLGSQIIKDQALINLLIKGNYIESEIHESLNESLHFVKVEDLPPWLVFMKFDEISDIQSNAAAEKLLTQFNEREVDHIGEMLHLFALRFLLSDMGMITTNFDQTEIDCKKYLDELLAQDRLQSNMNSTNVFGDEYSHGYNGYTFWVQDNYRSHFRNVVDHLTTSRLNAAKKLFPAIAQDLLTLVKTDGALFARQISRTFSGNNIYANIDILASIEPSDFVQEWMGSPSQNWQYISRGLEQRYSSGELQSTLQSEKKWLQEVTELLNKQHKRERGIRKKRIERILPNVLLDPTK
ncbi:P-loop NTPase fold protein [Pseudomonas sp. NPDC087626]|uniref:P-loop NTPase fold protein n=1 Tax=Pseudomonas sp. NPDC087626 TaxID=3364444 RepID=UPI0037F8B70E